MPGRFPNKNIRFVNAICLGVCLLSACGGSGKTSVVNQKITAVEAKEIMDSGRAYILLDVRTAEEYAGGHIAGAVLIPDDEISRRAESELPDKTVMILVYCRSGVRSARAASQLAALGYTHIYDMGGMIDWPYDIVK